MAGIYVHIPFCKSRCIYCAFFSTTDGDERQRYVDALCHEALMRPTPDTIETIYLGGGTPSQLTTRQLQQLFDCLYHTYKVSDTAEITIEVNPDDVTADFARALPQLGINRVSMGAQTFDDCRLRFLHRRHSASQVTTAVESLRQAGINNISIDLMYGFPEESLSDWRNDLNHALDLNVEHLSAYCLMIEEGTMLYHLLSVKGSDFGVDEETERQMYELLIDCLTSAGYEHYELSNFARPGRRSRHNSSYWTGIPYIGLGAAAHSYDGHRRSWNPDDLHYYIKGIKDGTLQREGEELDESTHYNDRITVALRTCEGLCLDELSAYHRNYLLRSARRYIDDGLLTLEGNSLHLSRKGLFVSDMVMADLMLVED